MGISAPNTAMYGQAFKIKCKALKSLHGMSAQVYENGVPGVMRTVSNKGNCTMSVQANQRGSRKFWVILSRGGDASTFNKVIVQIA